MMEADYQLLKESLLPVADAREGKGDEARPAPTADAGREAEEAVVRVVLNPSVLDRLLRGDRYHFYDDVPVPHDELLRGADLPLLPSHKARLLRGKGEDCGEGEVFGYLWTRLCARLSAARADHYRREGPRLCLRGFAWSVVVLFLVVLIAESDSDTTSAIAFSILAILNVSPLVARFADAPLSERLAQEIVDEMAPYFIEEGFHVDLITSSPMYIRFKKVNSLGSSGPYSSSTLKESMSKFQERARRDHQDAAIDRRQARLRENGMGGSWIFCVPVETVAEWEPTIVRFIITFGVFFAALTVMTFLGFARCFPEC